MADPVAGRPFIAHPEYGIPDHDNGLVAWPWVVERLSSERNYWVATVTSGGAPIARPVWGVVVDGTICFGGGSKTKWSRNLERDPRVSLHLESGTEVVIAEGSVDRLTDASIRGSARSTTRTRRSTRCATGRRCGCSGPTSCWPGATSRRT